MANKVENQEAKTNLVGESAVESVGKSHPYHTPNLVHYGALAELVQVNPSLGPDGGSADCQHA